MAEAIFNALTRDAELPFRAESAGVSVLEDEPMTPNARVALEELGIYTVDHHARQISEKMVNEADLILTMSTQHTIELHRIFGNLARETCTLPEYANGGTGQKEISDPYGHTKAAYRASARQILEYVDLLVVSLSNEQRAYFEGYPQRYSLESSQGG